MNISMTTQSISLDGRTWARFVRMVKNFAASEAGGKARWRFTLLIALLFAINGLNVVNSYVGRDFMTAIENRNLSGFVGQAILYVGVFAASTVVAVFYRFSEETLGLTWREWLTRRAVGRYLEPPVYYRLSDRLIANGEIANPDQRIADDVRAFTATTLSFVLMFLNGSFTILAFAGVMWSISPLLFGVAVLYAAAGSYLTIVLGRPLIGLNINQLDREADFRADLIHVRENAESVALARREGRLETRLSRRIAEWATNFQRIIAVNRNLGFFTTGYNYLVQIIPALVVAPLFIRGEIEFGVITQSAMAFAQLVGAFSLIVTQFQSISSYTAVVARLGSLAEAIEQAESAPVLASEVCEHHRRTAECPLCAARPVPASAIEVCECEEECGLTYERLTLLSPTDGHILLKELSASVPCGTRLLILGSNEEAKVALFRATAGTWEAGEGRLIRPCHGRILFLPERPYLPPGTLREVLLPAGQESSIPEDRMLATLRALELDPVLARAGGLDVEQDWNNILSLGEQQRLAFAHILLAAPRFVFLDRAGTALSPRQVHQILDMLAENSITYLNIGEADEPLDYYDAVLELAGDGGWQWKTVQAGRG
ncbi:ABC transporter transmembrane domain-containing protein [Methylocaldum sp. 14B]|jgi:putative ATP-binding cassette transporter|uniref:ABC transporter ATP-binding protein/permease n=1 Tax=Methylocaldum sp. 14B TaxID=1912213 RepID=UPI001F0A06FE|nr:ABC transporter transmembrane domain-containing protein [Methylocaldum sp. 14B]